MRGLSLLSHPTDRDRTRRSHDMAADESFPSELNDRLTAFDEALSKMDNVIQSLHGTPLSQLHEKLSSLDKARLDLVGVYAVNSLFWMYLNCKGENPKEHGVKQELDRVRRYMDRVREVQEMLADKVRQPHLNKNAAKRFMRSALWQAAHNKASTVPESETEPAGATPTSSSVPEVEITETSVSEGTALKRTADQQDESEPQKKKKKRKKKQNK